MKKTALCLLVCVIIIGCKPTQVADPVAAVLRTGRPTLVEFGAGTCMACVKMKPIITELQNEYKDRANVLLIDVNEYRDLTPKYKIMLIPTQVFFNHAGAEIYRHVGFFPKDSIMIFLKQAGLE